jgi:hypothetical protein
MRSACSNTTSAPGMARDLRGASPLQAVMVGTASTRQGRHREMGSEGSLRQTMDSTNRNRIQGRPGVGNPASDGDAQ